MIGISAFGIVVFLCDDTNVLAYTRVLSVLGESGLYTSFVSSYDIILGFYDTFLKLKLGTLLSSSKFFSSQNGSLSLALRSLVLRRLQQSTV